MGGHLLLTQGGNGQVTLERKRLMDALSVALLGEQVIAQRLMMASRSLLAVVAISETSKSGGQ